MGYGKYSTNTSKMPKITFIKQNLVVNVREGTEFKRIPYFNSATPLKFGCCQGSCGTCAIKVIQGEENLSPLSVNEKNTLCRLGLHSHRLACQCAIKGDVIIEV